MSSAPLTSIRTTRNSHDQRADDVLDVVGTPDFDQDDEE